MTAGNYLTVAHLAADAWHAAVNSAEVTQLLGRDMRAALEEVIPPGMQRDRALAVAAAVVGLMVRGEIEPEDRARAAAAMSQVLMAHAVMP